MSLFSLYAQRFPRYGPSVRVTGQFSKLPYLAMKLGNWPNFQKLHRVCLPRGRRNWAYFRSTDSGFRDIWHFSKLPYFGMKLCHWPKFQKLHIYSLSTPRGISQGVEIEFIFPLRAVVSEIGPIFKIAIFGQETWPLAKFRKLHIYSLSTPGGQN